MIPNRPKPRTPIRIQAPEGRPYAHLNGQTFHSRVIAGLATVQAGGVSYTIERGEFETLGPPE